MNIEPFLDHLQTRRRCSPETLSAYRSDLKLFGSFLRERSITRIAEVDHAVINSYLEYMRTMDNPRFRRTGLSDASMARRLAAVSGYLEYLRATTQPRLRNPVKDFARRWQKNNEPKPVEEYTLDLLLASMTNVRDRALFTLFVATGMRVSEMHQFNRDSINIELEVDPKGLEHITGCGEVIGKGNKRRKFYVDGTTLMTYAEYLDTRTDDNPALFLSERKQRMIRSGPKLKLFLNPHPM
jgi:site-specific recombinase XerD